MLGIILTFWITCAVIYVLKERCLPFSTSRSWLIIFDIIFAPYFIFYEIYNEWKETKHLRDKANEK